MARGQGAVNPDGGIQLAARMGSQRGLVVAPE
jgi:hypothetical protein